MESLDWGTVIGVGITVLTLLCSFMGVLWKLGLLQAGALKDLKTLMAFAKTHDGAWLLLRKADLEEELLKHGWGSVQSLLQFARDSHGQWRILTKEETLERIAERLERLNFISPPTGRTEVGQGSGGYSTHVLGIQAQLTSSTQELARIIDDKAEKLHGRISNHASESQSKFRSLELALHDNEKGMKEVLKALDDAEETMSHLLTRLSIHEAQERKMDELLASVSSQLTTLEYRISVVEESGESHEAL